MNEDPLAIKFDNEQARIMADMLAQTYYTAKSFVNFWNANNVASVIPNNSTIIDDGQALHVTNAQVTTIVTRAQEFITDYEGGSNAKLNTVLQVAVNYPARF